MNNINGVVTVPMEDINEFITAIVTIDTYYWDTLVFIIKKL